MARISQIMLETQPERHILSTWATIDFMLEYASFTGKTFASLLLYLKTLGQTPHGGRWYSQYRSGPAGGEGGLSGGESVARAMMGRAFGLAKEKGYAAVFLSGNLDFYR